MTGKGNKEGNVGRKMQEGMDDVMNLDHVEWNYHFYQEWKDNLYQE